MTLKKVNNTNLIIIFTLLLICVIGVFIYSVQSLRFQNKVEFVTESANFFINSIETNMFSKLRGISESVAGNQDIVKTLSGELPEDNPQVLLILRSLKAFSDSSIVYLMNKDGLVVASTDIDGMSTNLTGGNFSFRPYFKEAMKGNHFLYPALGTFTNDKGIYYSFPVYSTDSKKPQGVIVLKVKLNYLNTLLSSRKMCSFITTEKNLIFVSNNSDWLNEFTHLPDDETVKQIREERQFEPIIRENVLFKFGKNYVKVGNEKYFYIKKTIPDLYWNIYLFEKENTVYPLNSHQIATLSVIGLLFALQLIIIALMTKNIRKRKYAESELENRVCMRTKELTDTLNEINLIKAKLEASLEKLRSDEEAGRKIQMRLLPESYKLIKNFQFFHIFMPSMYLSGDFIDYFEIDERYIGFYLADVSGHGVSSAFVTVRIKSYITNMVMNYQEEKGSLILNPAALIEKMNTDLLFEKLEKHATIIYGIIDIKENKMIFSNAGQFPYPVLRSEGKSKFLETKGLPIGLIEYAKYKNNEINIPDDFFLVITSDGILELFPQKELSSKEDFLKQLVTETGFGINTLIEKSGIDSFETLPDDITILLIRRRKNE